MTDGPRRASILVDSRRARWWTFGILIAVGCVLVTLVLLMWEGPDGNATVDGLAGRWVSQSKDVPGTIVLNSDGSAHVEHLSAYDWWADPLELVADDLTADGTWTLHGYNLSLDLEPAGLEPVTLLLMVNKNAILGNSIVAIVGDPDGPRHVQTFRR